ncbi:hypothetical protein HAX54_035335, partial [Datura stramonium]|nr:hypothetical protein [Datura stramonium]
KRVTEEPTTYRCGMAPTVRLTTLRFVTDRHVWRHTQVPPLPSNGGLDNPLRE